MAAMNKVVVVDDGERTPDHALSVELAELGYASVTISVEATEEVLELIPPPSAIVLQLPKRRDGNYEPFLMLAERLRRSNAKSGVPVILVDPTLTVQSGGYASVIESEFASHAVSKPEL